MTPFVDSHRGIWLDLLTVAQAGYLLRGDPPMPDPAVRGLAAILLSRELVARLRGTDRDHDIRGSAGSVHPAFAAYHRTQSIDVSAALAGLLSPAEADDVEIPIRAGAHDAAFYLRRSTSRHHVYSGTQPGTAAPQSAYDAALSQVLADASVLIPEVQSDMGAAFATARQPFVDYMSYRDFNLLAPIFMLRVHETVSPGATFALQHRHRAVDGYSIGGAAVVVPSPGNYHLILRDVAKSTSTSNPTNITIEARVGGVVAGTYTAVRNSSDPDEFVQFNETDTILIDDDLTFTNGSANAETAEMRVQIVDASFALPSYP